MHALAKPSAEPSFEHKYLFARCHLHYVLGFLRYALAPDPNFSAGLISSIYYDTPALDLYHEKRASTYLKTKIRVRWYGLAAAANGFVNCYLEVKTKIGGSRRKERVPMKLPAAVLANSDLSNPQLAHVTDILHTLGRSYSGAIAPMLLVQYERQRLVDPASGLRVAVDVNIRCPAVNRRFIPATPPALLDVCVLEIKGSEREPPQWLEPIRQHVRRDSFSKYASCFEHLLQPAGRRE